jgi:hypothetical protein
MQKVDNQHFSEYEKEVKKIFEKKIKKKCLTI